LKLLWPDQSIKQQASSSFWDFYQNGIFLSLLMLVMFLLGGQRHWLCQVTRTAACLAIVVRMTHGVRIATAFVFFCFLLLAISFLHVFVVHPTFIAGDLGHEFAQSA
jgi:hypothetical protein